MDPSVREASTRSESFTYAQHCVWWDRRFHEATTRIWIAEKDSPIGFVRYGSGSPAQVGEAEVAIAVGPAFRGQGVANQLLTQTMPLAREELGVKTLVALVKVGNEASIGLFLGAGFKLKGEEWRMNKQHWRYEL